MTGVRRDFEPRDRTRARDRLGIAVSWVMSQQYYVYIMTNPRKTVLYTGVPNDLVKRVWQHRNGQGGGFTTKYHCSKLVLYEIFRDSYNAIVREKQIKAGSRRRKVELIERINPEWRDLYDVIARA